MFHEQDPDEFQLPSELAACERQLAGLSPAAVDVDRDRLMFAAGRAAAGAGSRERGAGSERIIAAGRFWPAAAAMMTAASIFLAAMLVWQRDVDQVAAKPQAETIMEVREDAVAPAAEKGAVQFDQFAVVHGGWPWPARPTSGYLGLRYVALTQGVGAIESRPIATNGDSEESPRPTTARELLDELLPAAGRASS